MSAEYKIYLFQICLTVGLIVMFILDFLLTGRIGLPLIAGIAALLWSLPRHNPIFIEWLEDWKDRYGK
ncbi:hypothetical protein FT641_19645 [Bacillus paranthracis]|uniref:hypothetical protein n=1 Tax=Bacillus paranthracis TaxID=2026186 RepID=UPI00187AC54D|nr:hypothetical protein [Bacillus paranthracis]MBE7114725.1 hypothetical protein [Bacillus paranthracis]MBE7154908.1 hypothetical protein [Bacillus paranthracis]